MSREPESLRGPERHLYRLRDHALIGGPIRVYFRFREQLLYLVVGAWNTVFGYLVWAIMQYVLSDYLSYIVILILSFPLAVTNAYLGYRYVVFRSSGPVNKEFPRVFLIYLVVFCINLFLLPLALRVLPFNIYVIQGLLTCIVIVFSYVANKYFAFSTSLRPQANGPDGPQGPTAPRES